MNYIGNILKAKDTIDKIHNYIYFKTLLAEVEPSVITAFLYSIIDHITISNGNVRTIMFVNGLQQTFIPKKTDN